MKEQLKKIGINLAVFYGLFSFAMMISLSIISAIPFSSGFLNAFLVFAGLPFAFYPYYWVGASLVIGLIVGYLFGRMKK